MQLNDTEREFAILLLGRSENGVSPLDEDALKKETGLTRRKVRSRIHSLWNVGLLIERDENGDKFCHIVDFVARFGVEPESLREQLRVGVAGGVSDG